MANETHMQLGCLHVQVLPHCTCAKRSLHMQSPDVPTTAVWTIAIAQTATMTRPSMPEAFVRVPP
eukprot:39178-Alexandrium_andersonii.AAC.1